MRKSFAPITSLKKSCAPITSLKKSCAPITSLKKTSASIKSNQTLFVTCAKYNSCRPHSEMLNTTGVVDLTVK